MAPATDSAKTSPVRRFWIGAALVTVCLETGCTQIRAFRKGNDRPVFGTQAADSSAGPNGGPSGDVYVDRLRQTGPGKPSLAQRLKESGSSTRDQEPADPRDEGPQIVLLPPVALPSGDRASESPVVETDEPAAELRTSSNRLDLEPKAPRFEPASTESAPGTIRASRPTLPALLSESRARLEDLTSYQVRMTHQERVGVILNPEEDVLLSVRRSPMAIRLEWPAGGHKGREVIYEPGKGNKMHVHMGDALIPRIAMAPDSPLAMRNSRHPIGEAGFNTILQNMELVLDRQQANDPSLGEIRYLGLEQTEPLSAPAHKIVRVTATHETWLVYIDAETHLPALVQATAANGEALERYVFRDLKIDVADLASATAFDPDARWGEPKGLLQRLVRAGADSPKTTESR